MNVADLMVAQPIYTGGRIVNGNRLASLGYEISKEKQSLTETEVLVKTEELYWTVITLEEKLKTLDSYILLLDTLHHDVNVALKAGLIQRSDLLKVQLKQNELQMNRMKLTNGIALSKRALCQHIGIEYNTTLTLNSFPEDKVMVSNQDSSKNVVTSRNEYKILEKVVTVEELQKKMIQGEYLPQVSVGAAGWYLDAMNNTNNNALVFATVSIPITDWWGGSHKLKESRAKVESARYKLAETTELLALQITQARNVMTENFFQISLAQKSVEQAKENLKVTNDNYVAGVTGMSDLLEAQSAYESVLNSLTEAKCNYQIARARYLQSVNSYK
jgi:outer membrane protein TolC